jgi:hypothetical protein
MDRMSKSFECGFVEGFGHRWMGVDRVGDIFEQCAHFECENELAMEFGDMAPDRLYAEDYVV